jgi:ribosome biogenesis GTPase
LIPASELRSTTLERLGFGPHFQAAFEPYAAEGLAPGRVTVQHRGAYVLCAETGELSAEPSGRLRHDGGRPVSGDWVAFRENQGGAPATIHAVLPRRTAVSRKTAWQAVEEQVLAANVDVVFLVAALNGDLNLRRLERYLATAWESGADPAIILNKSDLCEEVPERMAEVEAVALGVPTHAVSCVTGEGIDELRPYFEGDRTGALLGSSGVGKSTLINCLLGTEELAVQEVRRDGRGRHTTTTRELVLLPEGGLVLDTPGMRELQLWNVDEGLSAAFGDVESLAADCRFRDCGHDREPGCEVKRALADGTLDRARFLGYRKLQRELRALELKQDKRARSDERKRRRQFARARRHPKRW